MDKKLIVKRAGHTESYDQRKLYASIYSACLAVREAPQTAELIAEKVVAEVEKWLELKHEVTSGDLKLRAQASLKTLNPDAFYIYENHRNIH